MKKTIFLLLSIFFFFSSFAQIGEHFYGTPRNDLIQQVSETSEGDLLLLGTKTEITSLIWLQKIRPDGSVIWERTFPPNYTANEFGFGLKQEANGDILIVGKSQAVNGPSSGILLKCNSDGNLLMNERYHFLSALFDVERIGNHYFAVGHLKDPNGKDTGFIIKTDLFGIFVKHQTWVDGYQNLMKKIFPSDTHDEFYALGLSFVSGGNAFHVKRINYDLEPIWEKAFQTTYPRRAITKEDIFHEPIAAILTDNFEILAAAADKETEDIRLIRYSRSGEQLEKIVFGASHSEEFPRNLMQLENGDLMISGISSRPHTFITRVSSTGDEIWRKDFLFDEQKVDLFSQLQTKDKMLCFAGANLDVSDEDNLQGYLIKIDSNGIDRPVQIDAKIIFDLDGNCTADSEEPGLANWTLEMNNQRMNSVHSDSSGNFHIRLKPGGFTTLQLKNNNPREYEICQDRKAVLNDPDVPVQEVIFTVKIKVEEEQKILISPNPADAWVQVQLSPAPDPNQPIRWILYNPSGQRFKEGISDSGNISVNVSEFANGIYFFDFIDPNFSGRRFLIQK